MPGAPSGPAESRTSSRESPARRWPPGPWLPPAGGPCPQTSECRWAWSPIRSPSGCAPVARATLGSGQTWLGPAATGGWPPGPPHSLPPSVRPPRQPRPCAYAGTPRSASRCRCDGRVSSTPPAAIVSPPALSVVVALRWDQGSVSPASFPPTVSWPGAPFPPRGPSGRFPGFPGSTRRSDSPSPVPPHFVAFAWRYLGCTRISLPGLSSAPALGLELFTRYLPPGFAVEAKLQVVSGFGFGLCHPGIGGSDQHKQLVPQPLRSGRIGMHPIEHLCCQNAQCPDAGLRGRGNLTFRGWSGKGHRIRMAYCRTCTARFSERKATVLEQTRLPDATALDVLNHIREGCGTRATGRLVGVDKNTVTRYVARAGAHAEPLHQERVAFSPHDPGGPTR